MSIIASTHIDEFAGAILTPGDAGYDDARTVFNGAIDRRPAVIAQVCDAHDVAAALRHAPAEGLAVAVRCGGHSGAGFGVIDDGIVIDVRRLKRVEVDLARRTVRAGAGLTWGELDAATQAHGLAVTGGRMSTTGIAGLTLGSGSGWLERKLGLTADNLIGATVVITGGMLLFEWERAHEVLAAYRDVMADAPDELGGCASLQLGPPAPFVPAALVGRPILAIIVAAFADGDEAERLIAPLRALRPLVDVVAPMPYVALQRITDDGCPHGMQNHWKAAFLDDLPDAAIADAIDVAADIPSPLTVVLLQPLGGAYARVDEGATALSHRSARWAYHALSLWPDAADTAVNRAWTTRFAETMAAYGDGGVHPNHVSDPAGERVRSFYGEQTFARLVAVKDRWDPRNVFAANQNIRPSAG